MKRLLLIITILTVGQAKAQYKMTDKEREKHQKKVEKSKEKGDVLWDYDTVFNKGIPYCIVYEVEKGFLQHNDYSVRSLTGKELIYVKYATYIDNTIAHAPNQEPTRVGYYSYYFIDSKNTAETSLHKVYEEVVKNNLIDSGKSVNAISEAKFVSTQGKKYSQMNQQQTSTVVVPNYTLVERNKNASISILLNNISQDGKNIGSLKNSSANNNGIVSTTISFYLPNGTKVADAVATGSNSHTWNITTMRDNMKGSVSSPNNDTMDLVKYLISGNYL